MKTKIATVVPADALPVPKGWIAHVHVGQACWTLTDGLGIVKGGGAVRAMVAFTCDPVERSTKVDTMFLLPPLV